MAYHHNRHKRHKHPAAAAALDTVDEVEPLLSHAEVPAIRHQVSRPKDPEPRRHGPPLLTVRSAAPTVPEEAVVSKRIRFIP
jgi:hypothetical protein